ncbi:PKD domain-containing protein [Mitsuaria sp. GD03876]|uniref:PKD domain-containing protein n=1 Tax=Mitsuaria sp. GD03876 TaxID=2975399 RepID=UPI00244A8353|nr:PKD domain-containing protein [Mitsuaria sp. GD03876]MDH0865035.1 PKD domain-containing protein [Mitsuaria sp. GD03876]
MTSSLRTLMASLAGSAALLLAACGGGGGGGDAAPTPPVAIVKPSQASAPIGTTITLDGTGSTTPNGGTLSYAWTLSTKPEGSAAVLSDAAAAAPTFVADKPGDYVVDLVVKDAKAGSLASRVTLKVTNPDPVAVVSPASQSVLQGTTVILDGSASLPPTGAAAADLRYAWTLTEQPAGSIATVLADATSAKASFPAGKLGTYRATLTVRHGDRVSVAATAEVAVNNGNSRPVARITTPRTAVRGSTVVLDGSTSSDADGDALQYRWRFAPFVPNSTAQPRPGASTATIKDATGAKATLVPDAVGRYYIDLTVYDRSVATTERLILDVTRPADAPNLPPTARIDNGFPADECETGGYCAQTSTSHDADGDPLTATWTYWNVATPADRKTEVGPALYALSNLAVGGTWQVQLVVNDGQVDSAPVSTAITLKTGANRPPIADSVVETGTVLVGQTLWFDASKSSDRDGDPLSYEWTLVDRPDGSAATLQNPAAARSGVLTDKPGLYRVQLKVSDPKGKFRPAGQRNFAQGFAKAQNNAPVVANLRLRPIEATADQPLVIRAVTENGVTRTGVGVSVAASIFDPDLDAPLYYIVTATKFPAGSSFTPSLSGQVVQGISEPVDYGGFFLTLPGDYEFQVVASDGAAYSETKKLNVTVVKAENYPGPLLEDVSLGQQAWPHARPIDVGGLNFDPDTEPRVVGSYRLTATDGDVTIADLVASSTDVARPARFAGLRDGQVIRRGDSVEFQLLRPAIPDERALMQALYAMDTGSEAFKAEQARLQKRYADYRFTWSLRIAEKPGRVFRVGPRD